MKVRIIALYLPQFHPIPENDEWWGKGFTEWTNVGKATPFFKGHYQPRVPADLGYYDLRLPEIREQQAEMAQKAGVEGFCYWHYWFGNGRQLLERPFNEVLASGKPDFPFCLGWANHSWTNKNWKTVSNFSRDSTLIAQTYPGEEDHKNHFNSVLKAFRDKRYITVDGKPLFLIYKPLDVPEVGKFIQIWRGLAAKAGLPGIHFVGISENFEINQSLNGTNLPSSRSIDECADPLYRNILNLGFDAVLSRGMNRAHIKARSLFTYYLYKLLSRKLCIGGVLNRYKYKDIIRNLYVKEDAWENVYPAVISGWDRTPRSGSVSIVWEDFTPDLFYRNVSDAIQIVKDKPEQHRIVFLQSWNEWAEGNYVEPDLKYGRGFLNSIKKAIHDAEME